MVFTVGLLLLIVYFLLLFKLYATWTRKDKTLKPAYKDYSILVPVRNEAANIEACLASLFNQRFSRSYEVVLIDDQSEDETLAKGGHFDRLRVLSTSGRGGKKAALALGVGSADYDNIITVDGDCTVGENWLSTIDQSIDTETWLATGRVAIDPVNSTLSAYEHYDAVATMAATNYGIKNQLFYLANGCNLYFKKELFHEVMQDGEYQKYQSGDDVFLIKKAVEMKKKVAFIKSEEAMATTRPQSDIAALIAQRKRWSTKSKSYASANLLLLQGFVWGYATVCLLFIIAGYWNRSYLYAGLIILAGKFIGDYFFFWATKSRENKEIPIIYYFSASILYFFMIVLMGVYALFPSSYKWKGRAST